MKVPFDPSKPIQVDLSFESPHVVHFGINAKKPGDDEFSKVVEGANETQVQHTLDPLPLGSELQYFFMFIGGPKTSYRAVLSLSQNSKTLSESEQTVRGTTSAQGVRVRITGTELADEEE